MKVYIVSYKSKNTPWEDGVYCACDSMKKACNAICAYINQWGDNINYHSQESDVISSFETNTGVWRVERFLFNETGL